MTPHLAGHRERNGQASLRAASVWKGMENAMTAHARFRTNDQMVRSSGVHFLLRPGQRSARPPRRDPCRSKKEARSDIE